MERISFILHELAISSQKVDRCAQTQIKLNVLNIYAYTQNSFRLKPKLCSLKCLKDNGSFL